MATLLVLTVFLPLLGSLVLFLRPRLPMAQARWVALATALVTLLFSLVLTFAFKAGAGACPDHPGRA